MSQPTTEGRSSPVIVTQHGTGHASLAALGAYVHHVDLFAPIRAPFGAHYRLFSLRQARHPPHRERTWAARFTAE